MVSLDIDILRPPLYYILITHVPSLIKFSIEFNEIHRLRIRYSLYLCTKPDCYFLLIIKHFTGRLLYVTKATSQLTTNKATTNKATTNKATTKPARLTTRPYKPKIKPGDLPYSQVPRR